MLFIQSLSVFIIEHVYLCVALTLLAALSYLLPYRLRNKITTATNSIHDPIKSFISYTKKKLTDKNLQEHSVALRDEISLLKDIKHHSNEILNIINENNDPLTAYQKSYTHAIFVISNPSKSGLGALFALVLYCSNLNNEHIATMLEPLATTIREKGIQPY